MINFGRRAFQPKRCSRFSKSARSSSASPHHPTPSARFTRDLLPDATIEVWQANHFGSYDTEGYRYRAKLPLDSSGSYKFDSVMPGHYPDRVCQHIHYLVAAPGHKTLVTELYFATDPVFEGDPQKNFARDPQIQTPELIRPVLLVGEPEALHAAVRFELCLERL